MRFIKPVNFLRIVFRSFFAFLVGDPEEVTIECDCRQTWWREESTLLNAINKSLKPVLYPKYPVGRTEAVDAVERRQAPGFDHRKNLVS